MRFVHIACYLHVIQCNISLPLIRKLPFRNISINPYSWKYFLFLENLTRPNLFQGPPVGGIKVLKFQRELDRNFRSSRNRKMVKISSETNKSNKEVTESEV